MTLPALKNKSEAGISLIEVIIVLLVIAILSVYVYGLLRGSRLTNAETQALALADILQEARQRALTQRRTMRVEINATKQEIRLIHENQPGNASDDAIIKSSAFNRNGVFIGAPPSNMSNSPTELSPVPAPTFAVSVHPLSIGDQTAVFRFLPNGTVVNTGTNAAGANAVVTGATVFVWSKFDADTSTNPTVANVLRAVTVQGSSGATRMWKCPIADNQCSSWIK